jgi:phosphoribosylanthranilate isomerase
MTTRVKICGITRPEDAALAAELGADAIGLNFVAGPRQITLDLAATILKIVPPLVEPVGLFKVGAFDNVAADERLQNVESSIETKQWYGDYSRMGAHHWGAAGPRWWIVLHVASRDAVPEMPRQLARLSFKPQAILLDTASEKLGGTGQSFNWHWIAQARDAGELANLPPIILAGGLTPDNVAEAIRIAKPYAVDVSSGVEIPGKPGIKDPVKMRDFIQAAKQAL